MPLIPVAWPLHSILFQLEQMPHVTSLFFFFYWQTSLSSLRRSICSYTHEHRFTFMSTRLVDLQVQPTRDARRSVSPNLRNHPSSFVFHRSSSLTALSLEYFLLTLTIAPVHFFFVTPSLTEFANFAEGRGDRVFTRVDAVSKSSPRSWVGGRRSSATDRYISTVASTWICTDQLLPSFGDTTSLCATGIVGEARFSQRSNHLSARWDRYDSTQYIRFLATGGVIDVIRIFLWNGPRPTSFPKKCQVLLVLLYSNIVFIHISSNKNVCI